MTGSNPVLAVPAITADTGTLDAALALAESGFPVFPVDHPELARCAGIGQGHDPASCTQRGKHPAVAFAMAATTSQKMITTWFTGALRNIGVFCGPDLVVIDEDRLGELRRYADAHQVTIPATLTVSTFRGRHYYFQARADHPLGSHRGAFADYHIDVKAGNAYVVGPGSRHAEGGVAYMIETAGPPAPIPDWIIEAIDQRRPAATSTIAGSGWELVEVDRPGGLAAVPEIVRGPRADSGGVRHDVLIGYACSLRARSVPYAEAEELFKVVWRRCEQPPTATTALPWTEAQAKLVDVYSRYPEGPSAEYIVDVAAESTGEDRYSFELGGNFILNTPADPAPLWGDGSDVLLSDGEALIIAGGQGLGKTTLAQQLALGRAGFAEFDDLLGYPIKPGAGRVLYLAMDRPRQAARSFRRMVGEAWRDELNDRLLVWRGPPPQDLAKNPALLLAMCHEARADTVVIDSLKDAAIGLTDDEVGAGYNRARQKAITAGVQMIELHHNRKMINGAKAERPTIDDLYGSTWLPSGAGSVLLLTGAPGDPIVGLHHVKQPASEVGPLKIIHDHAAGRTEVWHAVDLVLLAGAVGGISAVDAAAALFDTNKPTASEKEKARRRLEVLANRGDLRVIQTGDKITNRATKWGRS